MSLKQSPNQVPATDAPAARSVGTEDLKSTGSRMQAAWSALLDTGTGQLPRPSALSSSWGLNQSQCTRLLQALRESDPFVALRHFPSPSALRGVIETARRQAVAPEVIAQAQWATDELEARINLFGGTKSNLDTMIARQLDHSREKIEQNAKQLVFRGMTNLLGVEAQTSVIQCFAFPSADPGFVDELVVHGYHGLRRLRPELPLMLGSREMLPDCDDQQSALLKTLQDGVVDVDGKTTALLDFCSKPFPDIEVKEERGRLIYALPAQPDVLGGELDLFFASMHRKSDPRIATAEHERARYAYIPHNPARQLVFDVYVHKDLWKGVEPELILAKVGNPATADLLAHSLDRMDFVEQLQSLGSSYSSISTPHYGQYGELVRSVHRDMGWELGDFRLYRCAVKYAVVSMWYTIQFRLPAAPSPAGS